MSLSDFLKAPVKAAGKGRSNQSQQRSKARVKDFNRDELENAASAMQQSPPGALDSFLGNVGSAFRPAGTFAAAAVDAVGGDGATKGLVSQVRAGSEAYKQSGLSGFLGKVPGIGSALDAAMNAPTGSSSNTMLGQGFAKAKELVTGVKEQDYLTDEFKARVARATEGSGFNDVARSIAENRQGQTQDNLVERTLGKLPAVGAYFDKNQPSVEDRAIEAGATPEQAAFISMLNPLEWVNAESKIDAEAKLAKAGKFRKGLNAVASPIVDPMQAAIDWAMPGKAFADVSPPGSIQEAFANNLGVSVDTLPALDNIAKPIAEALPVATPVAPNSQYSLVDDLSFALGHDEELKALAEAPDAYQVSIPHLDESNLAKLIDSPTTDSLNIGREAPLWSSAKNQEAIVSRRRLTAEQAATYEDRLGQLIDSPTTDSLNIGREAPLWSSAKNQEAIVSRRRLTDEQAATYEDRLRRLIDSPTTDSLSIGRIAPKAPENPVFAAARREAPLWSSAKNQEAIVSRRRLTDEQATTYEDRLGQLIDSPTSSSLRIANEFEDFSPAMLRRLIDSPTTDSLSIGRIAPKAPENPVFAAARAALKDPSLGDAVDQLDEVAPTWALEIPESKPLTLKEKVNTVAEAAASKVRRGAEPGTSIDLATAPIQKKVADSAKVDVERLHALEQSIETVKNSDLPPVQRKKKLAALQQEAVALRGRVEEVAMPKAPTLYDGTIQLNAGIIPSAAQIKYMKYVAGNLLKKAADNTVEMRASLRRWFSSTSLGKVDAKTTSAIRDGAEAADGFSRTLADAYHKVVNGNIAGIIGSQHGGVYNLGQKEKVAIRDFMGGRVANGVKVDEAALQAMGLPQDVIDVSKLVRGMMDQTSDALMAETHNLPLAWFTKLNDEDRAIVAGLAQTASKPKARVAFEKGVDPAKIQFLNDARQKVDDGFAELNAAGHWLDGEDPRDMLLAWAPYLANRGTYQPLLYRLFEHGVLSKGDDAMQLYIQTLKGKGVNVPAEVEAFLYSNWMAGGAKGKGFGNELDRIKKRNPNMPQAIKELLQEIEDPAYSYATGIFQVNRLRHQLGLRRWMAGQDKFVSRAGESAVDFALRNGWKNGEFVELADNVGANTRNFGAMQGRFVHRDFWDLAYQVHALPGTAGGSDAFMRFNKEILQRWKFWHTVANPASHIRQGVQNLVSVYLAGGNRAVFNLGAAAKEYKSRGKYFAMAREHGLLGNKSLHDIAEKIDDSAWRHLDFNAAESFIARMGRFGEAIANVSQGFRSGSETKRLSGKWAAAEWQMVDEVARIALLKTYVDKGWDVAKAAEAVKGEVYGGVRRSRFDQTLAGIPPSSTFADLGGDYSGKAIGVKALSLASQGFNVPFWGASRFILEQTLRNFAGMKPGTWMPLTDPGRMARTMGLVMAGYGLHKMAQTAEGMEPADEVSQRPDYMRPYLPMHSRIPSQWMELIDDKGKVGYFDLSWALPWGNLSSGGFNPKTGSMEARGGPNHRLPISPLWLPIVETLTNKDQFREEIGARSEIYLPLDTTASKLRKSGAHLWRSYLPPWAPNLAGGVVDAMRFDGGADGRVDAKEAFRAFMQGVASDSGHSASKLASGIFNSFDYWWDKAHPDGQERLQVSDYMGREQYLVKAVADALAVKITSTDLRQIQKRRVSAQTTAIKEMSNYYQQQRSNTTNPATQRRLRGEESKYIRQIKAGKPVARWYDESPEDTVRNVRNFFSDFFSR